MSVGLTLFLIILAALHYPALTLLGRAFAPFSTAPLPTRTQIELVQPREGDVTLPASRSIHVIARVGGRVPDAGAADALKLLFRRRQTDPYEEQPLDLVMDREWGATIPSALIETVLWYKVTGGDAETPEHRILVVPPPKVTRMDVTCRYRPYLCRLDQTYPDHNGNLKELAGPKRSSLSTPIQR